MKVLNDEIPSFLQGGTAGYESWSSYKSDNLDKIFSEYFQAGLEIVPVCFPIEKFYQMDYDEVTDECSGLMNMFLGRKFQGDSPISEAVAVEYADAVSDAEDLVINVELDDMDKSQTTRLYFSDEMNLCYSRKLKEIYFANGVVGNIIVLKNDEQFEVVLAYLYIAIVKRAQDMAAEGAHNGNNTISESNNSEGPAYLAGFRKVENYDEAAIKHMFDLCFSDDIISRLGVGFGTLQSIQGEEVEKQYRGKIIISLAKYNSNSPREIYVSYDYAISDMSNLMLYSEVEGQVKLGAGIYEGTELFCKDQTNEIFVRCGSFGQKLILDDDFQYEQALAYLYIATLRYYYSSAPATTAESSEENSNEESPDKGNSDKESGVDPYTRLNNLIGLDNIKKDITSLTNLMRMQKRREAQGLQQVPMSLHLVFSGNPGTGKTTIARILADIYKEIGVLSKGQLIEVDRAGLVAGYVGQTAIKTQEVIKKALGGILFIDEAYTLSKDGNDYGQEAIDTLLKAMEDHRDDFVVIVAGYEDLMNNFINSNPGLKSRFNKYMFFTDYNKDELIQIFEKLCEEYKYVMSEDAEEALNHIVSNMLDNKDENFANAREIRNIFEEVITKQASRLADDMDADITEIIASDFE